MSSLAQYLKSKRAEHLDQLMELLRIPSISTESAHAADVQRAAKWVRKRLQSAGCSHTELHLTAGHPIVYGEWLGARRAPTVLVYGHYDVQPVDPLGCGTRRPSSPP